MAKLYFHYSTMNAGKSAILLQAAHNYRERGMNPYLLSANFDDRAGTGKINSRIGIEAKCDTYHKDEDLYEKIADSHRDNPIDCVFLDEAQWLSEAQVWQLTKVVDELHIPVMTYGLRLDFRGELFPGSKALLAWADDLREIRTICHCGKKATMVVRLNEDGEVLHDGPQVQVGGNEQYVSLCRIHFKESMSTN